MSGEDKQSVCFSENAEVKPPSTRTWSGSPARGWLCATRANLSVADASTHTEPGWPQCCFISVGVKGQGRARTVQHKSGKPRSTTTTNPRRNRKFKGVKIFYKEINKQLLSVSPEVSEK